MSSGEEDLNDAAIATTTANVDPQKRGRKKRSRTELRLPPSAGKVQLEPKGSMQFSYVNYNPKGYKYGSQNETGLSYARLVKQEFWNLFTLCHYWASDEFLEKRRRAQESRLKAEEDVAQNRRGSRPWGETQQFLEYKYGSDKARTLNTYAVMKSGMKNVDASGNSAPIPGQKAKNCLDNYKQGVGPNDTSKELDGKVLYFMEGGLRHGRAPMSNGIVDKQEIIAAAKSKNVQTSNTAAYQSVVEENEQLRDTNERLMESNGKLKENNEILIEENNVNRQFILILARKHLLICLAV
ncbi:hypothetical protein QOZ80_8BG0662420 [Eleusine coracana subsp. coracana]|nr:hypothetical protein QOZ80_8BG0662420 [Eleusine coracana subsp. coracana]